MFLAVSAQTQERPSVEELEVPTSKHRLLTLEPTPARSLLVEAHTNAKLSNRETTPKTVILGSGFIKCSMYGEYDLTRSSSPWLSHPSHTFTVSLTRNRFLLCPRKIPLSDIMYSQLRKRNVCKHNNSFLRRTIRWKLANRQSIHESVFFNKSKKYCFALHAVYFFLFRSRTGSYYSPCFARKTKVTVYLSTQHSLLLDSPVPIDTGCCALHHMLNPFKLRLVTSRLALGFD